MLYTENDVFEYVKACIKAVSINDEISHREIARRAGITPTTLSRIVNGSKTVISAVEVLNIAVACGVIQPKKE